MSYCNHCGAVQEDSSAYCTNCGEAKVSLSSITPNQSATISVETIKQYVLDKSKKPYFLEAIGVISASVLFFIALLAIHSRTGMTVWGFLGFWVFFLLLCPLSFGAMVVLIAGPVPPKWLASFESWLDYRCAKADASDGRFNNYVVTPSLAAYEKLNTSTDKIVDDTLRVGAKAASYAFTVCLFLFLLYVVVEIILIAIMLILIAIFIKFCSEVFGNGDGYIARERTGFFGDKYTETTDASGNVVAESRERTGFLGDNYIETTDASGNVVSESRERSGFLGDKYTETKKRDS